MPIFDLESSLGVEVRRNQLVFCAMAKGLQGYTRRSYQVIEQYRDLESSELHSAVQQFVRGNGFNRENVILGLPRESVIVHSVELPLEVEENLDQVVEFQAAKLDPSEEESSYYDYVVLERNEKERSVLLQIVMVPKETIDSVLQLFRELSLYPVAVRFSTLGLQQLFKVHEAGFGSVPSLILHLEPDSVEIVLANGARQCLPHKRELEQDEALTLELILAEVDAFVSRLPVRVEACRQVYLSGSLAAEFLEPLAERFGDGELLVRGLKIKESAGSETPPGVLHAMGLAVSGLHRSSYARFNLIPRDKQLVGQRASLVPSLVLAGLFAAMLLLWSLSGFVQQRRMLEALEVEVQKLEPQVEEALQTRELWEGSLAKAEELHAMMSGRQRVLQVLSELTEKVPEDSYLQNLIIQGNKVTLTGYSQASAASLLPVLVDSDLIVNAESRYITQERTTGNEKFNFELTLREEESALP